jgi:hypothetical protein
MVSLMFFLLPVRTGRTQNVGKADWAVKRGLGRLVVSTPSSALTNIDFLDRLFICFEANDPFDERYSRSEI